MDGHQFDEITRALATGTSRRVVLRRLGAGLAGLGLAVGGRQTSRAVKGGGGGKPQGRCAEGFTNCRGTCVDLLGDSDNCGACATACPDATVCVGGACVCPTVGETYCSGACVDTQSDPLNCGGCGVVCTGEPTCFEGACVGEPGDPCTSSDACGSDLICCRDVCCPSDRCSAGLLCFL